MIVLEGLLALFAIAACIYWVKVAVLVGWGSTDERKSTRTWRAAWVLTAIALLLLVVFVVEKTVIVARTCGYQQACPVDSTSL